MLRVRGLLCGRVVHSLIETLGIPGSRSLPVSILFVGNVSAAFYGLQLIDVPMFLCIRRLTSLCVLVTEFFVLGKVSSRPVMAAIFTVMMGTLLAGYDSLSSNIVGYAYIMMNNILTALLYTWVRLSWHCFCPSVGEHV
jgi:hypothetical protein